MLLMATVSCEMVPGISSRMHHQVFVEPHSAAYWFGFILLGNTVAHYFIDSKEGKLF